MYIRSIQSTIQRLSHVYPVIAITGPRQSGKTTISKMLFPNLPYVSLENLDTRSIAQNDPRGFLKKYEDGAIFDEVQHAPEILSYLQEIVDSADMKGRYVLTGSQNFALNQHISQSLAGRVSMHTLLPLSLNELKDYSDSISNIFNGGYPALHKLKIHPVDFYPSYIHTYIERDVRQLLNIENLGKFQTFLKLCAGRIGQVINFSSLATDCGISHTTVNKWLSILEASYIIFFLQPFYNNFNKRLIKSPKLYFYDTGVACSLLGLEKQAQLETHYLKGSLYENIVVLEFIKHRLNLGLQPHIYFWRDRTGHEIDLVTEWGVDVRAFEIKSSSTFHPEYTNGLQYLSKIMKVKDSYLVYDGAQDGLYKNIHLLPISKIQNYI